MARLTVLCGLVAIPLALSSEFQSAQLPITGLPGQGTVTGSLVDAVTKLPLRFAQIRLVPKPTEAELSGAEADTEVKPHLRRVTGLADVAGNFRLQGVPAGDYLAGALMPGYLLPGTAVSSLAPTEDLKRLIASLPTVHVVAGNVAHVELSLRRGATIAGRLQFSDGSPILGSAVQWESVEDHLALKSIGMKRMSLLQQIEQEFYYYSEQRPTTATDDTGEYRISGLLPGSYIVSTIIYSQLSIGTQVLNE